MFYQGKKVLVTGGSGFIGTHIVLELLKQGANIRVPIHERPMIVKDDRIEIIQADLTNQEDCLRVLKGIDYVFHAAGAVAAAGVKGNGLMKVMAKNIILTVQMLEAAWSAGVERFLLFSSSTGYPAVDYAVKEEDMWSGPTHPNYFAYGWMRRYFERLGEFVASKSGVKIALVRPTAVYGRFDNFDLDTGHVIPALVRKAVERKDPFEVWGNGEEIRDLLHARDLASGALLMLEKYPVCDPVNIGYGQGATIKEVIKMILKAADYEDARLVFDTSKPSTIPIRMADTSKAKKVLGFEPEISLEQGLADTVKWYAETLKGNRQDSY